MRVENFLRSSALRTPQKTALVAGRARLGYGDLDLMSDRLAAAFRTRGVARGDRVAVFMDNGWEAVVTIFAVLKAGAVFVPINPSTKPEKLAHLLGHCRAAAIMTQARRVGVAAAALADAPSVRLALVCGDCCVPEAADWLRFEQAIVDTEDAPPESKSVGAGSDLAMLIYTSGTTGVPKGVMMTHRNVEAAATLVNAYLENRADDTILSALPISFSYGLYQIFMAFMVGATVVLENSFAFPQAILNRMKEEQVTGLPLVPTMAALILQMRDLKPGDFPHLRYITNAASPLPPTHIARLQELFPAARIFSMYGQTECKRATYLPPEQLALRPDSVGLAMPGTEAYVVDEAGQRVGPGIVGELVVSGPHVMQGYWENPEATGQALRPGALPGWNVLYTGDLFRADAEGFLYFVARKDDIIKTRGEKVSPKEVEDVLYALPGVEEAVVFGVPDPILGMAIKAVVACDPGAPLTSDEVIRHCARHLEDFMVPKIVEFRTGLPKSDNGKIVRRQIAELALGAQT